MKITFPGFINITVSMVCFFLFYAQESCAATDTLEVSVAVKTSLATQTEISDKLGVYGTIIPDPDHILNVSLPFAGLINRVWVKPGQRVKLGDRLLEIITAPESRMQYIQASSALDFANKELIRKRKLLKNQLITNADLEAAEKQLADAQSSLDSLKRKGLEKTQETLIAPLDGIITEISVSQGQRVLGDSTALLIASQNNLVIRLGVEPEAINRLSVGMPIKLNSVFASNMSISTKIRELHAMVNPATNLVNIYAEVPKDHTEPFILGSRVVGDIYFPSRTALLVPRSAVLEEENTSYLYKVVNEKAVRTNVSVGLEIGNQLEINQGITVGDSVVISGNYELKDGMSVRVEK